MLEGLASSILFLLLALFLFLLLTFCLFTMNKKRNILIERILGCWRSPLAANQMVRSCLRSSQWEKTIGLVLISDWPRGRWSRAQPPPPPPRTLRSPPLPHTHTLTPPSALARRACALKNNFLFQGLRRCLAEGLCGDGSFQHHCSGSANILAPANISASLRLHCLHRL